MRILVTGVAGLIGSWVAEALVKREDVDRVIGVDDLSGGDIRNVNIIRDRKFTFEHIDLMNKNIITELIASNRPHIIVHAAAIAREGASAFQPVRIAESNYMMSMILLENAIRFRTKKFVFFSSMAVMGSQKPPFDEEMPRDPVDVYGISKAAVERSIEQLSLVHSFDYAIIRPHNVFGPRQMLSDLYRNVAGIFMNRLMHHEPISIFGEGHKRAFSYIEDSLPAFINVIMENKKFRNDVVFIGGKEEITIDTLLAEILLHFKEYPKPEIIRLPARPLEVKEAYCSVEKSVRLLGYKETIGWKEGIKRMAEWAKQLGSQPWRTEYLPLESEKMPRPWAEVNRR